VCEAAIGAGVGSAEAVRFTPTASKITPSVAAARPRPALAFSRHLSTKDEPTDMVDRT
jgi:hypothetical protein